MARHGVRGMVTAWLGLIVLQAVAAGGSGKVAGFFGDVDRLVKRALDPSVPAIPDRRGAQAGPWPSSNVPAPTAWPSFNVPAPR